MAIGTATSLGSAVGAATTTTITVTAAASASVGDFLVVIVGGANAPAATCTVTDSAGNTWANDVTANSDARGLFFRSAQCTNAVTSGSSTFTATFSFGVFARHIAVFKVSGIATSSALDKTASAVGTAVGYDSGNTATLSQADELVVGACVSDSNSAETSTPGTGLTELFDNTNGSALNLAVNYKIVSATTAVKGDGTWTNSGGRNWTAAVATYKAAAGGGSGLTQDVNDTATLADAVVKAAATAPADTITASDATGKAVATVQGDTLTSSEAVSKAAATTQADGVTGTDAVSKQPGVNVADTATIDDPGFGNDPVTTIDDTLSISDNINTGATTSWTQPVDDTVTGTDAVSKAAGPGIADVATAADNASLAWAAVRQIGDTATIADNVNAGGSSALTQNINDTATVSDSLGRGWDALVAVNDTGTLAEGRSSSWGATAGVVDVLTLTEDVDGIGDPVIVYIGRAEPALVFAGRVD